MKRKIIKIDEEKCNGCGLCIPNCPEGAIQLIDGKARLISDLFCDGLGACIGECPEGAITIEEREAVPYDEKKVMVNVVKQGTNVIKAHLEHLISHGQQDYLREALEFLEENGLENPLTDVAPGGVCQSGGCPGSMSRTFARRQPQASSQTVSQSSLTHWPVQLHLASPRAPQYENSDLLLAADCAAFALGDFHGRYLQGRSLAIACPKLDSNQDRYLEKLGAMIDDARINTLTVMVMEVPCCLGLLVLAREAAVKAKRKVPVKRVVISLDGQVKSEDWL